MRLFAIVFFLNLFSLSAQDTIRTNYQSGVLHSIEYRGKSIRKRMHQKLPVRIVYNEDSTIYCELYYDFLKPKKRIWYENNIPVFGASGHCHNYFYKKGALIRKSTRNDSTRIQKNCDLKRESQQYSVDRGTFKNFILNNGTISYYTINHELTATIEVQNGYRKDDAVIYFKDSSLYRELRRMPNHADLNENRHIERSEASCITNVVIKNYVKNFSGLQHFTHLKSIKYLGNYIEVSNYASFSELIAKLSKVERRHVDRTGDFGIDHHDLEEIKIIPLNCQCAQSDYKPNVHTGEIHDFVDIPAEFNGGNKAFMQWIDSNLIIPDSLAQNRKSSGQVYVSFVVETDGSINSVKIIKSLNKTADLEILKLIKSMPKWIPAQLGNLIVRSRVRLPIRYFPR